MTKTSKSIAWGRLASLALLSLAFAGCASTTRNTTSVVDYLYPNSDKIETPSVPTLTLPLRVGIAFVPGASSTSRSGTTLPGASLISRPGASFVLTEKRKQDIMREVADHFKSYPFIKEIEPIPSAYLSPQGSFANLDQIKTMYGISAIVLLSYDQTQFTDEGALSLAYWTIVGAYVVRGEKNDTHTMLDAVVYDIPSRKMLFRAPGTSLVKGSATPINLGEQQRADSETGLGIASKEMIGNLDLQLAAFQDKVKERPAEYRVQASSGYRSTGGGDFDALSLALLAVLCGGFAWTRRRA
jgi:rhombotail lipoprotein